MYSCTHWLRPATPPPPSLGLIYEGAIGHSRQTTSLRNHLMYSIRHFLETLTHLVHVMFPGHLIGVEPHAVPDRLHVDRHVHRLTTTEISINQRGVAPVDC